MSEFKEELAEDVRDEEGLTLKDRAFLDFLTDQAQGDIRRAMDLAGIPKSVPTSAITKRLKKHIQERTKEFLATNTLKAASSLVGVLNDPTAMGAKNAIAAAKEVLDRGGVYKEEGLVVTEEKNMFILPPKDERDLEE